MRDPSDAAGSGRRAAVVDLHLHTTASDGRCTPGDLVERAARAGLTVIAVTDHDTTGAIRDARAAARKHGIDVVSGIEVTAMDEARDVHILGYFFDPENAVLRRFLVEQRAARLARAEAIGARLEALGVPIDVRALLAAARADESRSMGRPQVARALVAAGHATDVRDAFGRWLGRGRPAFVPRAGPSPPAVIALLHEAGGMASLAHPGKMHLEARIPAFAAAGLDALEAYHSDHDAALVARYLEMAGAMGLLVTGGSDFHGDPAEAREPGSVRLPEADYQRLRTAHAHGRP